MIVTYGAQPGVIPDGMLKAVRFPILAELDAQTGDHRMLLSSGARTRNLPLTIKMMPSDQMSHDGSVPVGALYEVSIDPATGQFSGRGFLIDDPNGRLTMSYIATQTMDKNSVDLAEVKARFVDDWDAEDWWVEFYDWALAATTIVATPAFANAHAVLDDELTASLLADPMEELVASFTAVEFRFEVTEVESRALEVTADGAGRPAFEDFYAPEPDKPQKIIVSEHLTVSGHLALWNTCHDGVLGKCTTVPRPSDNYTSFNKPGVLTDRGIVQTGPIFAYGGHRPGKGAPTLDEAYGGIENAWADVRIVEGRFGPWLSGRVRPGVSDETVYAARASRISGHWVGGRLKAIVSVNAEGFDVPGDELAASMAFSVTDGEVSELWAAFPACINGEAAKPEVLTAEISEASLTRLTELIKARLLAEADEPSTGELSAADLDMLRALQLDDEDEEPVPS